MKTKRQSTRRTHIQSAVTQYGTPLPEATLHRGIKAINQRIVARQRERLAETRRIERESQRIMQPMIDMAACDPRVLQAIKNRRRLTLGRKTPKITYPKVLQ